MRPDDHSCYIIHLLNPIAIIVATLQPKRVPASAIKKTYYYKDSEGLTEEWTLYFHHLFTTDFITEPEKQAMPLLDKAFRWYRAYLEWEDKNIDMDNYAQEN